MQDSTIYVRYGKRVKVVWQYPRNDVAGGYVSSKRHCEGNDKSIDGDIKPEAIQRCISVSMQIAAPKTHSIDCGGTISGIFLWTLRISTGSIGPHSPSMSQLSYFSVGESNSTLI